MNKPTINKDDLEEILEMTVPFPLLIYSNNTDELPIEVIYVEDVGENNMLNFPESVILVRMDGAGNKSTGVYELIESYKDYSKQYTDPENN